MWLKIEAGMLEAGDFGVSDSESNPGSGPESGPDSEADFPFPTFSGLTDPSDFRDLNSISRMILLLPLYNLHFARLHCTTPPFHLSGALALL